MVRLKDLSRITCLCDGEAVSDFFEHNMYRGRDFAKTTTDTTLAVGLSERACNCSTSGDCLTMFDLTWNIQGLYGLVMVGEFKDHLDHRMSLHNQRHLGITTSCGRIVLRQCTATPLQLLSFSETPDWS